MRWHRQLRWKLFLSHLAIVVVADIVLLATASFLARAGLSQDLPLSLGAAAAETGPVLPDATANDSLQRQFELVVQQALLVSGFAALATAVIVSLFVSRRIVEPLQAISTVSERLAQGFYRERTLISSDDELADLSRSVNQLAATLEQTEDRRRMLLADVTHEQRTPLSTIEGYAEGLLDGVVQPQRQVYGLIQHEATRMRRLIEDLELLSRAEAGQLTVVASVTNLHGLLGDMVRQFQPQFAVDSIALELLLPPSLPPVWADRDRVRQVLINLLTNAFRYTPEGGRVLLTAQEQGAMVQVSVADSGVGIAADDLPNIFERFYRVDKSRARTSGGSGIGLTIARHLVYAQGGAIWAESEGLGQGTTFSFTLPVAYGADGAEVAPGV
jgi:histidine kinase